MPRFTPPLSHCSMQTDEDGVWDAAGRPIANAADPELPTDLATKAYVDAGAAGGRVVGRWRCDTTPAPLAAGAIRFDQATPAAVTAIDLASVTAGGTDLAGALAQFVTGDSVTVQVAADASRSGRYTLTAAPIDQGGGIWRLPVAYESSAGASFIVNGLDLLVALAQSPAATRRLVLALVLAGVPPLR